MNVAGAIHSAGSKPLRDFVWGEIVVNIINSLVEDPQPPITIDSTGKSIIKLLDSMSDREKNIILSYPISLIDQNGEFVLDITTEKKDPISIIIISIALIMIIVSFLITYFQASVAFNNGKSITDTIGPILDMLQQLMHMK